MVHHLQSCLKVPTLRLFFPLLYAIKHFAIVHLPQCDVFMHFFFCTRVTQEEKDPQERKARKWVPGMSEACRLRPHNKMLKVHFHAARCSLQSALAVHSLTLGLDNGRAHNYSRCDSNNVQRASAH